MRNRFHAAMDTGGSGRLRPPRLRRGAAGLLVAVMLAFPPAPPAAGAGFQSDDGWIAATAAGWRVGFNQVNGSFACGPAGDALPGVLRDGTDGLWRAAFLDGGVRRASEFGAAGARRFAWTLEPNRTTLLLAYSSAELNVTVEVRARDDGVDLQATVEPAAGTVVELGLPAQVRFDPETLRRLVMPTNSNESVGIAFSKAFFQAQPVDPPAGWETRAVGGAAYASLYGGALTFRPDADPKVALTVTEAGAAWFGPELSGVIAASQGRVNRPPAAGQEGIALVASVNGAYFSANHLGGAGRLFRIGGAVDEIDAPLAARMVEAALEHLAATAPAGRATVALIDLARGQERGSWAAVPVGVWRERLASNAVLRNAGLSFVSLESVAQLQAALGSSDCLAIVNPYGEALPVPAPGGMPAMAAALRNYVRAGGAWFETGGHPFYYELTPQRYLEYATGYPPGFSDFLHCEFAAGNVALYGVQPRPFPPWAAAANPSLKFVPGRLHCGGDAAGGRAGRAFAAYVPAGARWTSPTVRLRLGADAWQALRSYGADNGFERPLAEKLDAPILAKLKAAVMLYYGGSAREKRAHLSRLPSPTLIHFADYLRGGFDKQYPDHLPPNAGFGTAAELRAFFDEARAAGHLVMPYTNPTWWCDHPRGPTFLREGEAPLLRRLDGSLSHETYGDNDGYTICHWHPAVRAANKATLDEFTSDYPVDVLFQDQCGARAWVYDLNPASPDPLAYSEGVISMVAADSASKPLATESGWDAIVNYEAMFCGMTWAVVPTRDPPAWRRLFRDRFPPAAWAIFPVAQILAHDKAVLIHHDLGQFVTDDEVLAWTLSLGYGMSARMRASDLADRPAREWLCWLDRIQKTVCARYVGEPITEFEHDRAAAQAATDDGVIRARYGSVRITANLNAAALPFDDATLAPHGFLAEAPGMRAGLVAFDAPAGEPPQSAAFAGEFAGEAADLWIYSTSDREVILPWPAFLTAPVTAELEDGTGLPASLHRGRLSLTLGATPGVLRVAPPAELDGRAPAEWPGGPPRIGVLDLPGHPRSWTKVSPAEWTSALAASRLAALWRVPIRRITTMNGFLAALADGPPLWLAIINPSGENFPEGGPGQWQATLDAVRDFVRRGGHWFETGGYSFYAPAWHDGSAWHTETIGPSGAQRLGLPVVSGAVNQPPESVTPTAAGADLLGAEWVARVQGRTTAVNRSLGTGASDPGHLTFLAGPSGDFFGGYRLDGWGVLWRLGGMNPNPEIAVPSVVAALEYAATHPPLPPTASPTRYVWRAAVRIDAAAARFIRGDANASGIVDIADAVTILGYLFGAAQDPSKTKVEQCLDAADANDDGTIDIADAIALLGSLFAHAGPLPEPSGACGVDPTTDDALNCGSFPPCALRP